MDQEKGDKKKSEFTFVPESQRTPYDPQNKHRTKKEFVAWRKAQVEKKARLKQLSEEIDNENEKSVVDAPVVESPKEEVAPEKPAVKKGGRKKKA